jgi:drug/metabolite transporter (DMT)-like permease
MKQPPLKQYVYDVYDTVKNTVQPLHPKNQSEKTRALVAVGMVSLFWGTTWLASKKGVETVPGLQLAGIRQFLGGSIYLIYFLLIKKHPMPGLKLLMQFVWMSLLMFVISNGFSTWSLQYIPSGLGAVIGAISPIWIAVFSVIMIRETKLNLTTSLGLLLGFMGILIIFYDYLDAFLNTKFTIGIILGIFATMTWAIGTIYTVRHARDLNPYYSVGWQMFLSGVILTVTSRVTGQYVPLKETTPTTWFAIGYLVIIGSIITLAAFIYALKRLPPAQASVYAYINPIVAVIIGSLLNNEKLSMVIAGGTLVTLLGVYLVNTGYKKAKLSEDT